MRLVVELDVPNLSERLKKARKKSRLTQKNVARRVGVTPKTINHLETDLRGVSYNLLAKLCEQYGISVVDCVGLPELSGLENLIQER